MEECCDVFNKDKVTDRYSENAELIAEIIQTLMLFSKTVVLKKLPQYSKD